MQSTCFACDNGGLGHVPRPRNFAIANIICIGRFPCGLPPAILTPDPGWSGPRATQRTANKNPSHKDWDVYLVELSDADTNKYPVLLKQIALAKADKLKPTQTPPPSGDYISANKIHQQQKHLNGKEVKALVAGYKQGATVYELAKQFGCHRTTVSEILKRNNVKMRRTPLTEKQIQEAIKLYESGLSLVKVGKRIGADGETVRLRLNERGVKMRDAHERDKG